MLLPGVVEYQKPCMQFTLSLPTVMFQYAHCYAIYCLSAGAMLFSVNRCVTGNCVLNLQTKVMSSMDGTDSPASNEETVVHDEPASSK